jgi:hypothetical protein
MAIEVNSASWTGNEPDTASTAHVCGVFTDKDRLQEALSRLEGSIFQRADLSVRIPGRADDASYTNQETPVREDDVRNLRQLGVGLSTAVAAMAAAGITIATGGAALPAVVAAAAAGGVTAGAGEAIGQAAAPRGESEQQEAADAGGVILMVHAPSADRQAKAEELLRACGATRVWRQGGAEASAGEAPSR